jgi:hypothetical protein
MADRKITDLPELTSIAGGDFLTVVDVSDTTESPEGTSKKIQKDNLGGDVFYYYNNMGHKRFTFPANSNLVEHNANYGANEFQASSTDYGSTDFTAYLGDVLLRNHVAFFAPFDMQLVQNRSLGGFSGSWQGFDLRFCLGYYEPTYLTSSPDIVKANPTVILDKNYTTEAYVDMQEDIVSVITIPKGAAVVYTYAHLRASTVNGYIKTGLIFKKV